MAFISVADEIAKRSITSIENKFITKYLPVLDSMAVKVYLFALYIYQNGQTAYTISDIAQKFEVSEEDIKNCFEYLEEFELISITSLSPFEIKILDCNNNYGSPKKLKPEKYADFSNEIQSIISGRMISTNEFLDYYYMIEEYGFERNAVLMIINYCVDLKGNDIRFQYIKKVLKSFAEENLLTAKKVEDKLSSYNSSTPEIVNLFTTLGINKHPELDDEKLYIKWTTEMEFTFDAIVSASKLSKCKSLDRLDSVIIELYKNKKFDVKEIQEYFSSKNSVYQCAKDIAKELGIYVQDIAPYVENYVSVWLNYGYEQDSLRLIANYCFMQGKNTFDAMNDFVSSLLDLGIVTESNVEEKLSSIAKEDKQIKNILSACGLSRKIIPLDRECLKRWRAWNFSDEMIFKSAELSAGKNNPVAYMNSILSSWKNDGITSIEKLSPTVQTSGTTTESKKAIIERHFYDLRNAAEQRADKALKKAMTDKVYADIDRQLRSLNIQLAFAEIRDENKAKEISKSIQSLEKQGDERLLKLGIKKESFTPSYQCKICNDTGYDASGKQCVCLQKFIKDNNL